MTHVFVYGTLKSGHGNHRLLASADHIGEGATADPAHLYDLGGIPGLVFHTEGSHVRGEVYCVNDETLARLDQLESNGSLYQRELRHIRLDSRRTVEAYVYVFMRDPQYYPTCGDVWLRD